MEMVKMLQLNGEARAGIENAVVGILDGYDTGKQGEIAIRYLTAMSAFNRARWRAELAVRQANKEWSDE